MDAETRRQIGELDEQRSAHKSRLQVLEVQAARMGNGTPPEIVTEIGDIKSKLTPIDAAIFKLTYVGSVRADVPNDDAPDGERRESRIGMAVERTMERNRRAMVASQTDQLMYLDIRLDSALREVRLALIAVAALAVLALFAALGTLIYLKAHGL